jgi:hypothetical protein
MVVLAGSFAVVLATSVATVSPPYQATPNMLCGISEILNPILNLLSIIFFLSQPEGELHSGAEGASELCKWYATLLPGARERQPDGL